ncbi:hypothetical protein OG851_42735 (plasmid) [Streptomyces sp. NBC_00161]|uniref:hypothetical protein n=1 Tax=Streptomyces sp. NBC_00161 TaxID=2975671 RepID=UPI002F91B90D
MRIAERQTGVGNRFSVSQRFDPLARRGQRYLATAVMIALVALAALAAGQVLILFAGWLPLIMWPLTTFLFVLGATARLAGQLGLVASVGLTPLVIAQYLATRRPAYDVDHRENTH